MISDVGKTTIRFYKSLFIHINIILGFDNPWIGTHYPWLEQNLVLSIHDQNNDKVNNWDI